MPLKVIEYNLKIYLLLFELKKFMFLLIFTLWSLRMTFFFISNLFIVCFAVTCEKH